METLTKPKITAQELRIGNWVYETSYDNPQFDTQKNRDLYKVDFWKIAAINGIYNTAYDPDDKITQIEYLYPIPLTPEILEKAGFTLAEYFARLGKITLKQTYDGYVPIGERYSIGVELKYLHQLQNIYFALTGEELNIIL